MRIYHYLYNAVVSTSCALSLLAFSQQLHADSQLPEAQIKNAKSVEFISLEIPEDCRSVIEGRDISHKTIPDAYLEAYIQGVLDTRYPDLGAIVTVRNGSIFLTHRSSDSEKNDAVTTFVQALTKRQVATETRSDKIANKKSGKADLVSSADEKVFKSEGIWLPQSTILYPTEVANPRQICFSIGARFKDKLGGTWATPISFGDQLPMYRWTNVRGGDLQLELEAGVFGLFNMKRKSYPLINADYYVGVPVTYAKGKWAFRARGYHISSHIGDEWLLDHKHMKRKNKSFEAADISTSYAITPKLRVYGTIGAIIFSDSEMHLKPLYFQYGFEARGTRTDYAQLFGQPFIAAHIQNAQDTHFGFDSTIAVGYEWGKIQGIGRKVRLFAEYHHGFSPDGQYSRWKTHYVALRLSYGF